MIRKLLVIATNPAFMHFSRLRSCVLLFKGLAAGGGPAAGGQAAGEAAGGQAAGGQAAGEAAGGQAAGVGCPQAAGPAGTLSICLNQGGVVAAYMQCYL